MLVRDAKSSQLCPFFVFMSNNLCFPSFISFHDRIYLLAFDLKSNTSGWFVPLTGKLR